MISRILGFFYRIFLSHTIGASGLGLYQLIFPVFTLCLAISASGIQTAISRFVASSHDKKKYLFTGLLLAGLLSGLFSVLIYIAAPWIANDILKEPRTAELLRVMVFSLVPASVHSCFNGYYYGKKESAVPSACQIIEQLARVLGTLIIYYVLLENGLPLKPVHAVWGLVISELAGFLVNITAYLFQSPISGTSESHFKAIERRSSIVNTGFSNYLDDVVSTAKSLGLLAVPLTLNHVLMTLSHSLENLLLPQQLVAYGYSSDEALAHFGILTGMALSVIFFPSAITNSLSVLLLPRISETKAKGDMCVVLDTIKGALCCGIALGSLCTFVFLLSADWFGNFVFHNTLAGFYIRILSILCPFMYTAILLSSIVNGLGHATLTLICNLSGCVVRILAIWFLVSQYGMYAYIISMIVAAIVTTVELLLVIKMKCTSSTSSY